MTVKPTLISRLSTRYRKEAGPGIVRVPQPQAPGAVLVAVNGSRSSHEALGWAATEAAVRGAQLHVGHGFTVPVA